MRVLASIALACVLATTITGCAHTTATYTADGTLTLASTRLLTNSAANLTRADGTTMGVTSAVDQAGTAAAFKALGDTISLLAKVVVPVAAVPPPVPFEPSVR